MQRKKKLHEQVVFGAVGIPVVVQMWGVSHAYFVFPMMLSVLCCSIQDIADESQLVTAVTPGMALQKEPLQTAEDRAPHSSDTEVAIQRSTIQMSTLQC